jgi:hypothetical protein
MAPPPRRGERVVTTAAPPSDAYVGLLGISLGALVLGCVLLLMDKLEYDDKKPPQAPSYTGLPKETPSPTGS